MQLSRARALGLTAAALLAPAAARPAAAQAVTTLKAGTSPTDAYAEPLYFAPAGEAAKAGIALDVSLFSSSTATAAGCASGALDVGVADPIAIANGVVHGIPFRMLAPCSVYTGVTTSYVCVARGAPITSAKDLNGATFGAVTLASSVAFVAVRAWLATGGADLSTIKFVEMPYASMAAAIERGTIAAASIAEPFVSQLPPGVKTLANPNEAMGHYATSVWFATAPWLANNAAVARRLVAAIYDVARWSNEHQAETGAALAAATHVDPERVKSMHRATFVTAPETAPIEVSLAAAVKYGVLSRPVGLGELMATL